MYFPDLSPYHYNIAEPQQDLLHIGWLSIDHPFPTEPPNERLAEALRKLIAARVNLFRGFHICEFCPKPPTVLSKQGIPMIAPPPGTTGNGEIRVPGANAKTYAAPVLILHYVVEHQYLPPQEFINAVLAAV